VAHKHVYKLDVGNTVNGSNWKYDTKLWGYVW